ncbi:MopE-related protein [Archangium sp.]|uniref:MopE-related protein n=1 Tax=Archangium sp. TaxID=1872627 RepID=UPI00286AF91A|nr:MopE-related protein [Archangium sp.]
MKTFLPVSSAALLALVASSSIADVKSAKVDICHHEGHSGRYHVISVSRNSLASHLGNHGDHYPGTFYVDGDNDGFGDMGGTINQCLNEGFVADASDCNDGDASVHPGAEEICGDNIDNDCDSVVDEGCLPDNCAGGSFEGHDYAICQGRLNFSQAQAECAAMGWDLSRIDSEAENTWVVNTALAAFGCTNFYDTSYWISNLKNETPAIWPSGSRIWAIGEPNGDGNNVHLMRYCEQPYQWNDVPAFHAWGWVCESKH